MNLRCMVITLVTLRLFFLLQLTSALAVDVIDTGASAIVLMKQVLQLAKQSGGCQQHRWIALGTDIVDEKRRISSALRCR